MNLERRFIIAFRPKYQTEDIIDYTLNKKRLRCYIVLKDYKETYLVVELKYFDKKDRELEKMTSSKYHFLKKDSIINDYVTLIDARDIIYYSDELIDNYDFNLIMTRLKGNNSAILESNISELFQEFCREYYFAKIKEGVILTIKNNGNYTPYYVKEKNLDSFLGIKLHYDSKVGLSVDGEEKTFTFEGDFEDIFYSEEYSTKVLKMINNHK